MDANANRAREGIRTAEDFARFELQDFRWAKLLRGLRHQVTAMLGACCDVKELKAARRVQADCGRADTAGEFRVDAQPGELLGEVAIRGLKRAQEAVRVLEEYTRAGAPEAAQAFSRIRFELYEAEQWMEAGTERVRILQAARLYVLVAQEQCRLGLEATVAGAIKGGAGIIQLREKGLDDRRLVERARNMQKICAKNEAILIVNDRPDIALLAGAAGVHLGQDDLSPSDVRKMAGEQLLIGRSTHGVDEVKRAVEEGVDYIAIGAMYESRTKENTISAGLKLAEQVAEMALEVPIFAIGGIKKDNIEDLKRVGVRRIAVSSAITSEADPLESARALREELLK